MATYPNSEMPPEVVWLVAAGTFDEYVCAGAAETMEPCWLRSTGLAAAGAAAPSASAREIIPAVRR
jgi:hypothetical protein